MEETIVKYNTCHQMNYIISDFTNLHSLISFWLVNKASSRFGLYLLHFTWIVASQKTNKYYTKSIMPQISITFQVSLTFNNCVLILVIVDLKLIVYKILILYIQSPQLNVLEKIEWQRRMKQLNNWQENLLPNCCCVYMTVDTLLPVLLLQPKHLQVLV